MRQLRFSRRRPSCKVSAHFENTGIMISPGHVMKFSLVTEGRAAGRCRMYMCGERVITSTTTTTTATVLAVAGARRAELHLSRKEHPQLGSRDTTVAWQ